MFRKIEKKLPKKQTRTKKQQSTKMIRFTYRLYKGFGDSTKYDTQTKLPKRQQTTKQINGLKKTVKDEKRDFIVCLKLKRFHIAKK